MHTLYHSYFNECGSWLLLEQYLQLVVSFTTDLGTESGFAQAGPVDIQMFFPYHWEADEPQTLHMPRALQVIGVLHIMDNVMKHICDCLECFGRVRKQIEALSLFLRKPYTRERLVTTCFSAAPASAWAYLMSGVVPSLIDWRWGVLSAVLRDLLDREVPLRSHWSLQRVQLQALFT